MKEVEFVAHFKVLFQYWPEWIGENHVNPPLERQSSSAKIQPQDLHNMKERYITVTVQVLKSE
jgi:hypothetical protein